MTVIELLNLLPSICYMPEDQDLLGMDCEYVLDNFEEIESEDKDEVCWPVEYIALAIKLGKNISSIDIEDYNREEWYNIVDMVHDLYDVKDFQGMKKLYLEALERDLLC